MAQTVKNLPTVWETWVPSLGQEDTLWHNSVSTVKTVTPNLSPQFSHLKSSKRLPESGSGP